DGLQTIINLEHDMRVVGVADNGEDAVELVRRLRPSIALLDVQMPVMDGIEATRRIASECPETKVIVLTTFDDEQYIVDSLAYGAVGFLLKELPADKLVQAMRDAAQGQLLLPGAVAGKLAARLARHEPTAGRTLRLDRLRREGIAFTEREREIAELVVEGLANKEIAKKLYMSEGTVKNYVSVIYQKIGTNDRLRAIAFLKEYMRP
ncbi:response regulator transcription factor, partial [Paenibacillus sp.]|uniref:response regulator transcription factor n=1 Tax=Paenibacillus sp. TaxID=58172 RepID=UPI002D236B86